MTRQNTLENTLNRWNQVIAIKPDDAKAYIQRGMVNFKLAKIEASIQDFDQAEKIDPRLTPYLWQRGLSYYYAQRFAAGAKQFEIDLTVNSRDVEETVWRYLCQAQLSGADEARKQLLTVKNDPRRVMQRVYDLFAGNCTTDDVIATGELEGRRGIFYSYLYVGLYYEAAGDRALCQKYIQDAVAQRIIDDYMWHLACVHLELREGNQV